MRDKLTRGFAVFLILWVIADLSVAGFCPLDDPMPSFAQASQTLSVLALTSNPAQSQGEGRCFCCSPQVIPPALSKHTALSTPTKLALSAWTIVQQQLPRNDLLLTLLFCPAV
jgi:hypothetical protein